MQSDGIRELIRRAVAGDAEAWRDLHARCQEHLQLTAQRLMGPGWPEQSASDFMQNTWCKVLNSLAQFRGAATDADTAAAFRAWLKLIMKSLFANTVRAANTEKRRPPRPRTRLSAESTAADPPDPGPTPSFPLRQDEEHHRLGAAMAALDTEEGDIIERFYFQGQSLNSIADSLGLTYDQVRERKDRAVKKLGAVLRE
jgi:RNA polymerase sigma factor (sigma-70 family)